MSSVSPDGGRNQQGFERRPTPLPEELVRTLLQFDAAGWSDDDYDPPPTTPAGPAGPSGGVAVAPLPCRRGTLADGRLVYSLSVVLILPDPDDAEDPEYLADGQEMLEFAYLEDAKEAADMYAACPEELPEIRVPGVTHVVVNDWRGAERYRRRIEPGGPRRAA